MTRRLSALQISLLCAGALMLIMLLPHAQPALRVRALTPTVPTHTPKPPPVHTNTPTSTPTICPMPTPLPFWVLPVTSPTDALTQTIRVYSPGASKIVIVSEAGGVTYTGPGFAPAHVTINLLPNTVHHLQVQVTIPGHSSGGCTYPGYTMSRTTDEKGNPLTILQGDAPTLTPTSLTPSPTEDWPTITLTPPTATRTPVQVGANLLRNPGFELDADGDGKADGWAPTTYVGRSSAAKHGGSYSLRHHANGGRSYAVGQPVRDVAPRRSYWLGGWVYIPSGTGLQSYQLEVLWRNSAGQTLRVDTLGPITSPTGGWQYQGGYVTAPGQASSAFVRMRVRGLSGTIYADDLIFRRQVIPTPTSAQPTPTLAPPHFTGYVRYDNDWGPGMPGVPIYLAVDDEPGLQRATTDQNGYYAFYVDLGIGARHTLYLYTEPRSEPHVVELDYYGYGGSYYETFIMGIGSNTPTPKPPTPTYEPTITLEWPSVTPDPNSPTKTLVVGTPSSTPEAFGPNLVRNPGFEFDANGDGKADEWSANSYVSRSSAARHGGQYSLRHYATDGAGYEIRQRIDQIKPNHIYKFSSWLNITQGTQTSYFTQLVWRDGANAVIGAYQTGLYNGTQGWQQLSFTLPSPSHARSVTIRMVVEHLNGTIYADDFVLREKEYPPTTTPLPPDFTPTVAPVTVHGYARDGSASGPGVAGVPIYMAIGNGPAEPRATTNANGYYQFVAHPQEHYQTLYIHTEPRSEPYVYEWYYYGDGGAQQLDFVMGIGSRSPTPYSGTPTMPPHEPYLTATPTPY